MEERIDCSAETLSIYDEINSTAIPYPELSIAMLFELQVQLRGDATAVCCGSESLSYRQVSALANSLADRLMSSGVRPGDIIGVCVSRSVELILSLLAIAKCGAAYLPFDAAWPDEFTEDVLGRSRATHIVVRDAATFARMAARHVITECNRETLHQVTANPAVSVPAESIAYVNFTSGTTGVSKGVQISHRSVGRLVLNARYARLGPGALVLQMAPTAFDAATFEIWGPLLTGGTCVLYPARTVNIPDLRTLLQAQVVNCIFLTTALFNIIVDEAPEILDRIETILFGGEAYSPRHVELAFRRYGPGRIVHVYGPTECTTFATYYPLTEMPTTDTRLPIGRPIQNTKLYVARDSRLCGTGETGEILLGGPGLSAGYVGDDSASRKAFGSFDIAGHPERLYRTGDHGYLSESRQLVFEGRIDDQVKVSGYRIELADVARVLSDHPGVTQSYLTVSDEPAEEKVLLAFAVPADPAVTVAEVRRYLALRLPKYMIPGKIYLRESLPLLASGKVDRRALVRMHWDAAQ